MPLPFLVVCRQSQAAAVVGQRAAHNPWDNVNVPHAAGKVQRTRRWLRFPCSGVVAAENAGRKSKLGGVIGLRGASHRGPVVTGRSYLTP